MSAEHDVSAKSLSRKVPTKRHPVAHKPSRWDASDSHLISLTLLHVHSSRRALAHSSLLHFPSLPPYYNIMHFFFIGILSFLLLKCIHVDMKTTIHILMYSCVNEYMNPPVYIAQSKTPKYDLFGENKNHSCFLIMICIPWYSFAPHHEECYWSST